MASLFVTLLYPVVRDTPAIIDLLESYPEALLKAMGISDLSSYTQPSGYLGTQLFAAYVPILFLIFAIGMGANAIAGEEDRRTLDVLLANPVSRTRVLLEKAVALSIMVGVLGVVVFVVVWSGGLWFSGWVGSLHLAAAVFSAFLLGLAFGFLALAAGAATGRKGLAIAVVTAVAAATFILQGVAPLASELNWLEKLSPFYYYRGNQPLRYGLSWSHAAVLAGLAALFLSMAVWSFGRRDVGVAQEG